MVIISRFQVLLAIALCLALAAGLGDAKVYFAERLFDDKKISKPCSKCTDHSAKSKSTVPILDVSEASEEVLPVQTEKGNSDRSVLFKDFSLDEQEVTEIEDEDSIFAGNSTFGFRLPNKNSSETGTDVESHRREVLNQLSTDGRCITSEGFELQCPSGSCCSAFGWCTFDKSSCPSTYGPNVKMAADGKCEPGKIMCPMNACCSKWGWCGFSELHCSAKHGCEENCQENPTPGLVRIGNRTELPFDQQIMHTLPIAKENGTSLFGPDALDSDYEPLAPAPMNARGMSYPDFEAAKEQGFSVEQFPDQEEQNSFESLAPVNQVSHKYNNLNSGIDVEVDAIDSEIEEGSSATSYPKDEVAYSIQDDVRAKSADTHADTPAAPLASVRLPTDPTERMESEKYSCGNKGCYKTEEHAALTLPKETTVRNAIKVEESVAPVARQHCSGCHSKHRVLNVTTIVSDTKLPGTLTGRPPMAFDWAPEVKKCSKRGVASFVFEGGPDIYTPLLLNLFKLHNASATFLVEPSTLKTPMYANIVRTAALEGHQIGMAFYPDKVEDSKSLVSEIDEAIKRFRSVLEGLYPSYVYVRRPLMTRHFLSRREKIIRKEFGLRGLKLVNPEIVIDDLNPQTVNNPDKVFKMIYKAVRFPLPFLSSYMIQLHDSSQSTVSQMNATLHYFTHKGLRVVTVADCVHDAPSSYYTAVDY